MAMTAELEGREVGIDGLVEALASYVSGLDVGLVSGADAARLTELFARGERLCATGKAMAARRAAQCSIGTKTGARSDAEWLAGVSGGGIGDAQAALDTAEQMESQPELGEACRQGLLSPDQAAEITQASKADPGSTDRLVEQAQKRSLKGLKEACRSVRNHAASRQDDEERLRRLQQERHFRHFQKADGGGRLFGELAPDDYARFVACFEPFVRDAFGAARKDGRREPTDRYAADALLAMAESATSQTGSGAKRPPPATVIAVVDHAALLRGHTLDGETCEIEGIGPVPVAVVTEMAKDAFLAAVVKKGVDIRSVVHLGHDPTALQRSALIARDRHCAVPGCDVTHGLESHHVKPWEDTHQTRLDDLARVCSHHHDQISYEHWTLDGPPNQRSWAPPEGGPPPGPFDDDGIHLQPGDIPTPPVGGP